MSGGRYRNRRVLVTGGLGFIGSNLTLALVREGAEITVVDALVEGCGGNEANLGPARTGVRLCRSNIGDTRAMADVLPGNEVIFNLAGEVSHFRSVQDPERDLELNARAQLRFLEACRRWAPRARVVYTSTRQVYGRPRYLPVDEDHPAAPVDFNGVHKLAAEAYHRLQSSLYGLQTVCLRLTNVYGPRQALHLPSQGFIAVFLSRLLRGEDVCVYGEGTQLRDLLYVDDAVEALLRAGLAPLPPGSVHATCNVGGPRALPLAEIARTVAGSRVRRVPFPTDLLPIDIGSYSTDDRRFRAWTGWEPRVELPEGVARTLAYYRAHVCHDSDPAGRPSGASPAVLGTIPP